MRDLSEIEAFVSVIRAGGFLPAERSTGIPKSTLSRKVAALEDRLGTSLVKRTTRQLKLTDAGEVYYQGCADALSEIERVEQMAVDSQAQPKGLIRMTAPVETANDILPQMITDFQKLYPEIEIEIDLSDRIVDLVGENFDLALRGGGLTNSSSLVAKKISMSEFKLFASPAYFAKRSLPKNPKDLSEERCIYFYTDTTDAHWEIQNQAGHRSTVRISNHIRVNSLLMAKNLAITGAGIALVPTFMCDNETITGELVPILPEWRAFYGGAFYLVTPKKKYTPPRVKLFVDFIAKRLKEKL